MTNMDISLLKHKNLLLLLSKLNFQWYVAQMKDILLRYKIFAFLLVAVLAPSLGFLHQLLIEPLQALLISDNSPQFNILGLFAYQFIALLWIAAHRPVFAKQTWNKYFSTLALQTRYKIFTDIFLLATINSILWVPLVIAAIDLSSEAHSVFAMLLVAEKCILIMLLTLLMQLSVLKKFYLLLISSLFLDLAYLYVQVNVSEFWQNPLLLVLFGFITATVIASYRLNKKKIKISSPRTKIVADLKFSSQVLSHSSNSSLKPWSTFAKLQCQNLLNANRAEMSIIACALMASLSLAILLLILVDSTRLVPLLASFLNALILSNLFVKLSHLRAPYQAYLSTLPLTRWFVASNDIAIVTAALFIPNLLLFVLTFYLDQSLWRYAAIFLSAYLFLLLTYYPQVKFKRQGFFVSLIVMNIFITTLLRWI